jgi:hypothetical protein
MSKLLKLQAMPTAIRDPQYPPLSSFTVVVGCY